MREPGASEVLMCGCTRKPASTAFFASSPAASSTPGLEVLVQLVMAAISTSPLPMVKSCAVVGADAASDWADASVGLLASISISKRGAAAGVGGVDGTLGSGVS